VRCAAASIIGQDAGIANMEPDMDFFIGFVGRNKESWQVYDYMELPWRKMYDNMKFKQFK
jgi:hypothetical protein